MPDLRASDLGGGGVLHQVEDGDRAVAAQPGREVLQRDADVVADAPLGDLAVGNTRIQELGGGDLDVVAQPIEQV